MNKLFITLIITAAFFPLFAQNQWRYDRTGIYAEERGLSIAWSPEGPEMLWYFDGLGIGHSSATVSNDKVYTTGLIDGKGYLFVFDMNGVLLQKLLYGDEWTGSYPGTRATPTVSNGKIYLISGTGDFICWDENTLDVIWQRNILTDFKSKNITWGINESPLLIGDMIIATPGDTVQHNVVALNKNTGELIWSSPGKGEPSAYCSPLYIGDQETPLIVTLTKGHILGLEAATGKLLWSFENRNRNHIHSNTPVYADNMVLITSVDKGCTMLRLTDGGRKAEIVWEMPEWDNMQGGLVKVGDYVYGSGSGYKERVWYCVDWNTGEIKYKAADLGMGVIIYADERFYCYTDRGEMALVKATPERFEVISRFMITKGTEQHWAHPVIHKGVLYVRHGDSLIAYKIK
jgi:outer membrane protein assembly factor BamB